MDKRMGTTPTEKFVNPKCILEPGQTVFNNPPIYGGAPILNSFLTVLGSFIATTDIITELGQERDNDGNYTFEVKTFSNVLLDQELVKSDSKQKYEIPLSSIHLLKDSAKTLLSQSVSITF